MHIIQKYQKYLFKKLRNSLFSIEIFFKLSQNFLKLLQNASHFNPNEQDFASMFHYCPVLWKLFICGRLSWILPQMTVNFLQYFHPFPIVLPFYCKSKYVHSPSWKMKAFSLASKWTYTFFFNRTGEFFWDQRQFCWGFW